MSRDLHEHRGDVDGAQEGGEEDAAVHAVDLRRAEGILEGAHALGVDHVARQARIAHGAVAELAFLEHVPQGVDLLVHRRFRAHLVALEALHDTGVEGLAQHFVNEGMLLVHVGRVEEARAHEGGLAVGQWLHVAYEAFVHAPHAECAVALPPVLAVDHHLRHHVDGFGLLVGAQGLVAPEDFGVDDVLLVLLGQDEGGGGAGVEGRFGEVDVYDGPLLRRSESDGHAGLGVAQAFPVHGLHNLGVGRGQREDGRGEEVAAQGVYNLVVVHEGAAHHHKNGDGADQHDQGTDHDYQAPHETAALYPYEAGEHGA